MIVRVAGTLLGIGPDGAALVAQGAAQEIVLEVAMPAFCRENIQGQRGARVTLYTHLILEGSGQGAHLTPRLAGFVSEQDRAFFVLLTTVRGLGRRKALRAMTEPPAAIAEAIGRRDVKWLQRLPEVGKRLAETLSAELHDKVGAYLQGPGAGAGAEVQTTVQPDDAGAEDGLTPAAGQAVAALVRLGEPAEAARGKVLRAIEHAPQLGTEKASPDEILAAAFGV